MHCAYLIASSFMSKLCLPGNLGSQTLSNLIAKYDNSTCFSVERFGKMVIATTAVPLTSGSRYTKRESSQ